MNGMTIEEIQACLPHRYPFLLVDRVVECELGKSLVAIKNVTMNEPFFTGHFPQKPVMPGVLMIEALAQAAGILLLKTLNVSVSPGAQFLLAGVDNARFKRQVIPGDQLLLRVEIIKNRQNLWIFQGQVTVEGQIVCMAEILTAQI